MIESRLDRLVAYFSPTRGARRLAARRAMQTLSYEGARRGRREEGWIAGAGTSANAEIAQDREILRDRVRSLLRDNPYAVKGVSTLVSNRIGTGIMTSPNSPNDRLNRRLASRWERWVDRADITGNTDYYGLQALAERARIESGAALIRFIPLVQPEDKDDVPLRLHVLEPDHIDTSKNARLDNGNQIIEGIEYRGSRPVGYWLYPDHPGDRAALLRRSTESTRIPASEVIHYYRVQRPGQLTGVSELAPVIRRLRDLDGYAGAELMRKKIAACMIGFVQTPSGLPAGSIGPTEAQSDGTRNERFEPGMWVYGQPGESAEFFDPKPSDDYDKFFEVELHAIASGLNMPYELLTGDLSEVNYTSHRGGLVQFRAMIESDQWQLVIPQICDRVWRKFVGASEMRPGLSVPAEFTPPRFGLLDPAKETPAMVESIAGGLESWQNTVRREGYDPEKVLAEIEQERRWFAERGIRITSFESKSGGSEGGGGSDPEPQPDEEEEEAA